MSLQASCMLIGVAMVNGANNIVCFFYSLSCEDFQTSVLEKFGHMVDTDMYVGRDVAFAIAILFVFK